MLVVHYYNKLNVSGNQPTKPRHRKNNMVFIQQEVILRKLLISYLNYFYKSNF